MGSEWASSMAELDKRGASGPTYTPITLILIVVAGKLGASAGVGSVLVRVTNDVCWRIFFLVLVLLVFLVFLGFGGLGDFAPRRFLGGRPQGKTPTFQHPAVGMDDDIQGTK